MNVGLIGPDQAARLVGATLTGQNADTARDVKALIDVFHAGHVGLPPSVALDMRQSFARRGLVDGTSRLRKPVYLRLLDALGIPRSVRSDPRQFDYLPWPVMVEKCLLPLGALAIDKIGRTLLYSREAALADFSTGQIAEYEHDFWAAVTSICRPRDPTDKPKPAGPVDLFWEQTAHKLWTEVRRQQRGEVPSSRGSLQAAELDDAALRFLCGLDPEVSIEHDATRLRLEMSEDQNPLLTRPKQGGIVGIHHTSRLDDVDDMLLTELMSPPVLLADKLLNSSYMARHRPPPYDERRQILVLGCAVDDPQSASIAFAKSAWLDAVFRFAILLYHNGLLRSELRFAQFSREAGISSTKTAVGAYPQFESLHAGTATRAQARRYFCDAGWLPGFVASLPGAAVPEHAPGDGEDLRSNRLTRMLQHLVPERHGMTAREATDFQLALATVLTLQEKISGQRLALPGRHGAEALPLSSLRVECPLAFEGGAEFLIMRDIDDDLPDDGNPGAASGAKSARKAVALPGNRGDRPTREALEAASAELTRHIFDFYWGNVDG